MKPKPWPEVPIAPNRSAVPDDRRWSPSSWPRLSHLTAFVALIFAVLCGRGLAKADPLSPPSSRMKPPAYVVADSPYWEKVTRQLDARRVRTGYSFNTKFDTYLPKAHGHTLVVAMLSGKRVLPARYWPAETGVTIELLERRMSEASEGTLERTLDDGTKVFVVFGRDPDSLTRVIEAL